MMEYSVAKLSPHCSFRVEGATRTNLGIQSKVQTLVLFSWVSCYWARDIKHVCNCLFVCLSLEVVYVEKWINKPFKNKVCSQYQAWMVNGPFTYTLLGKKRAPSEELVSQWIPQSLARDTRSFSCQHLQWLTTRVLFLCCFTASFCQIVILRFCCTIILGYKAHPKFSTNLPPENRFFLKKTCAL